MNYSLPTCLEIGGKEYEIRSDYRAALDIFAALSDPDLSDEDKAEAALTIFYPDFDDMPPEDYVDALKACFEFLNGGREDKGHKGPQLVSWEQDFEYIAAPISRVTGRDIRGLDYLHWWSFLSAYMEIGDCLFAQIVRIRNKRAKGVKLTKEESKWFRENRDLVNIQKTYSENERDVLKSWGGA